MKKIAIISISALLSSMVYCQENLKWDDQQSKDWPDECQVISIPSSVDQKQQPAYYYRSKSSVSKPLVVSLHTWSSGYDQKDPLVRQCIENDYHYIHPHFRGPNNSFEACGSELVISDIDDAIQYALEQGNVDTSNIHIIGVSGGGYATLLAYMKSEHDVKTFSAWVPISDLIKWYGESKGRKNKYAKDVAMATTGIAFENDHYYIDTAEAIKRSPIFMQTPVKKRKNSKLFIYAGIHDGYTGSVPITHSLEFYNKVVSSFDPEHRDLVTEQDMITMLASRSYHSGLTETIGNRRIHFRKNYKGLVSVCIFEGTHEQLDSVALDHIPTRKILTIGDSNGAIEGGWVEQLQKIRFSDAIYNTSIAGNTIGFDNLGNKSLNTLRNIDTYLEKGCEQLEGLDAIIIMLGTNDCKAVFSDSTRAAAKNLSTLLKQIKSTDVYSINNPEIIIALPPPIAEDEMLISKYLGARNRMEKLIPRIIRTAEKASCHIVDTHTPLVSDFKEFTSDGIHLNKKGQCLLASEIDLALQRIFGD